MKERPILFSGEMVRAILEGQKTQTRRVVKPHFARLLAVYPDASINTNCIFENGSSRIRCPYGQPGDQLWVKETHCKLDPNLHGPLGINEKIVYRADNPNQDEDSKRIMREYGYKWKPSIFMPRGASRITLDIVNVRVERLNDISEEDAKAEGIEYIPSIDTWCDYMNDSNTYTEARQSYASLWESINGVDSWDLNPWVWVIEFKRIAL